LAEEFLGGGDAGDLEGVEACERGCGIVGVVIRMGTEDIGSFDGADELASSDFRGGRRPLVAVVVGE
jgi:hypothetical protein